MSEGLLDANVLIRFLTRDVPTQADAARALMIRASEGEVHLRMTALTFAEVVWVLERFYGCAKAEIADAMNRAMALPGLYLEEADVLATATAMYADLNVDFIDAYQAAHALNRGITTIYSYDRHLDRIAGITRVEP